jgi:cytochrome d ubiquinol oxidase subunit I
MGRQPWVVNPGENNVFLLTDLGVSGNVSALSVGLSVVIFTLLYTGLGVVWFLLLRRYAREGINTKKKVIEYDAAADAPMSFVY